MKKILLVGLAIAGAIPSFGQGRDTVFAIHKLFCEKRAAGDGLLTAGATTAAGTQYAQRPNGRPTAQEARQDALASTAFTGVGLFKTARYSAENEAKVLKFYAAGWGLPPDLRRKLRRRHFHRTAHDLPPVP